MKEKFEEEFEKVFASLERLREITRRY